MFELWNSGNVYDQGGYIGGSIEVPLPGGGTATIGGGGNVGGGSQPGGYYGGGYPGGYYGGNYPPVYQNTSNRGGLFGGDNSLLLLLIVVALVFAFKD